MKLPEIVFFLGFGIAFWICGTVFYRASGAMIFETTRLRFWLNWVLMPPLSAAVCVALFLARHFDARQWAVAALLIALPGMFGEALILSGLARFMPKLAAETGGPYGGFLFATYGFVLAICEIVSLSSRP